MKIKHTLKLQSPEYMRPSEEIPSSSQQGIGENTQEITALISAVLL